MTDEDKAKRWLDNRLGYLWHWWINTLEPDGPAGNPHERKLYSFKSMLESLGYFESYLRKAFTGTLPSVHQQCSHSAPVPLEKPNRAQCALGKVVTECPILLSLKESFTKNREGHYKDKVPDEAVYGLMAKTCAWHLLAEEREGAFIDWNEGAMQDVSDRMYWSNVYDSLSQSTEDGQNGVES